MSAASTSKAQAATRVLPPNVSEQDFEKALAEFREVVGSSHVETVDTSTLVDGGYMDQPKTHDCFYLLDQTELVASAVVRPGNTEEVQALVRIANKYKIPIWVTSIGRNLGYGGAARTSPFCPVRLMWQHESVDPCCSIWERG